MEQYNEETPTEQEDVFTPDEAEFKDVEFPSEAESQEDELQSFGPIARVDPADLPTLDEIRRLRKELDRNSKSLESLIQTAKESKLEKNLLQTIHLNLPDEDVEPSSRTRSANRRKTLQADKLGLAISGKNLVEVEAEDGSSAGKTRPNCLFSKDLEYYDGTTELMREDPISYFYRQLKRGTDSSETAADEDRLSGEELDDNNNNSNDNENNNNNNTYVEQWRQMQLLEEEQQTKGQRGDIAMKETSANLHDEPNKSDEVKMAANTQPKQEANGQSVQAKLEKRKFELAAFTRRLGKRISRITKDAALLDEPIRRHPSSSLSGQSF